MKRKVIIRTDGNLHIGLGHLVRCIALAEMIDHEFEIQFASLDAPDSYIDEINNKGYNFSEISSEDSFIETLKVGEIVVLDGYNFDYSYQSRVKKSGVYLVCIDDLSEGQFTADMIINHAPNVNAHNYKAKINTSFALGLDYALLRPAFLNQATKNRSISKIQNAFICFGGGDYLNLTFSALKIVSKFPQFEKIIVLTGAAYKSKDSIQEIVKKDRRVFHYHDITETDVLDLMCESDLAIVPSSGILLEALSAGCYILSGTYADNQQVFFNRFLESGCISNAGNFTEDEIIRGINEALNSCVQKQMLVDGKSGQRILEKFVEITLSIRKANENDCRLMLIWANDLDVRKNAISTDVIDLEQHTKWFKSKLNSADSTMFILEKDGKPAGQVRYDKTDDFYTIDYSIAKEFRGLGLGKYIIKNTLNFVSNGKFRALVKSHNQASINVFKRLKFIQKNSVILNNLEYEAFELVPILD